MCLIKKKKKRKLIDSRVIRVQKLHIQVETIFHFVEYKYFFLQNGSIPFTNTTNCL